MFSSATQEKHQIAWEALAQEIACNQDKIQKNTFQKTSQPGELIIIGSGIQSMGFIQGEEELIQRADAVFYCVADPGTITWIQTLRPDAYDLYVLYGNHKPRYTTYMQMTEALLHYVRQGKKVVAVYYGHPGIFALSPHRAILLAKREGHSASMRPGVSALDCLCADLGIDPAHPGLQTHEATDMLIRKRVPNTTLHLVLWQVGLIGEMGFRDQGYINQHFFVLVAYLQEFYGLDYSVTHYVASRYATIAPIIETYPLQELYDPRIQSKITGISTFYLPPKDPAPADLYMLQKVGMLKPGITVQTPPQNPLREIGLYGPREGLAFADFKRFTIPASYQYQKKTEASRFLVALQRDWSLQEIYEANPAEALDRFPALTPTEKALLATRNANYIQAAAKGLTWRSPENEQFLLALFSQQKLVTSLCRALEKIPFPLSSWSKEQGYAPQWDLLCKSFFRMCRDWLLPWTGIYVMDDTYVITIQGSFSHPRKGRVYVNGQRVCVFAFSHGVLSWSKQEHLSVHGLLRLDISSQGKRRLTGSIWKEHTPTSIPQIAFAQEAALESCPKYPLIGVYTRGQEERLSLSPPQLDSPTRKIHVTLNQEQIEEEIRYQGNPPILSIGFHRFVLTSLPQASEQWSLEKNLAPYFYGSYVVKIESQLFTITVQKEGIWFGETSLKLTGQGHKSIEWTEGPDRYPKGSMAFFLDPITLVPCCSGTLQSDLENVVFVHGMVPAYPESSAKSTALALFNIPQPLWMRVLKQSQEESRQGGSFLWTNWCKVHRTINLLHALFKKL